MQTAYPRLAPRAPRTSPGSGGAEGWAAGQRADLGGAGSAARRALPGGALDGDASVQASRPPRRRRPATLAGDGPSLT